MTSSQHSHTRLYIPFEWQSNTVNFEKAGLECSASMDRAWADLGVTPGASQDIIKQEYRKLVLQYHPDRHASSSKVEQEAATARFKVITEAYDLLTDERARAAYQTSASRSNHNRGHTYRHNVNTDWTQSYYNSNSSSSSYTSRLSRWEWYRRAAQAGGREFSRSLHAGLAVLLVGGGLMLEYSYTMVWQAHNRGKSFEEVQQAIKTQQKSKTTSYTSSDHSSSSSTDKQSRVAHISSAWADGMRGRFVSADNSDSSINPSSGDG